MKNRLFFSFFVFLIGMQFMVAQSKQWSIEDCVQYALKNNISITQSEYDKQLADIDKKGAVANLLPAINANSSHSWNIGLNQNITTGLLENQTTQFTSAGLNADVVIFNGMQNQNRIRRAMLSQLAATYKITKIKEDISLNVANAFLQILFNKENLKIQKEQLQTNEKQLKRSEELVKSGLVARGDLLDMKATVAANKQAIITAENNLFLSKLSLAQLLQLKDFQGFDIADSMDANTFSTILDQTPASIFEKAKQHKASLEIAKANIDMAQKDVAIAKGAYLPSLHGFYSFSTRAGYSDRIVGIAPDATKPDKVIGYVTGTNALVYEPSLKALLANPLPVFDQFSNNKGHSFGVQLSIPILNGLTARNAVVRSKVALERSKTNFKQEELDLERSVYTAFFDAKGALNAFETAKTTLEARQEAFLYAKEKYAVGVMNSFDYSQSQTLYVNAMSEVSRAKYDYFFKIKTLEFYFGIPIIKN